MDKTFIKDFILESEILNREEIEKISDLAFEKNIDFLDALFELNLLDQETILRISSAIMGVPKVDLNDKVISLETFSKIPDLISDKYDLICFESKEKEVSVAFCRMESLDILDKIFQPDIKVNLFWTNLEDILEKKKKYLEMEKENWLFKSENNIRKMLKSNDLGFNFEKIPDNFSLDIANDTYTEKFLNSLLEYALRRQADFIFFNLSDDDIDISFRIFDRNYSIMKISKDVLFSILVKLKYLADIPLSKKFIIEQSSFNQDISGEKHNLFLTFTKTDLGESITIQIDKNRNFKLPMGILALKQKEKILKFQRKDSGMFWLFGDELGKKISLYSFLEYDMEKYKNIYTLEKEVFFPLAYTKQITLSVGDKFLPILIKIIDEQPDVLASEKISSASLPILFNFVSTSKKVFLLDDIEPGRFLDTFLSKDFDRGQIIKNLALVVGHQNFSKISEENGFNYFLKKEEERIIRTFLSKEEIKELFLSAGMKKFSQEKLTKIPFKINLTKKTGIFKKKDKRINKILEKELVLGVFDTGLFLENEFIKRHHKEKIKNNFRKEIKKKILENALLLSALGQIDIKEVIKFLTR